MCDYCGCRRSGPTAELAAEHRRLLDYSDVLHHALHSGVDAASVFAEFVLLLQKHAAKEEIGLFDQARSLGPLADQIEILCSEHEDLRRWLADGLAGTQVAAALRLLATHIDDEEYDLFPHIFHALDPEQWDEIELAHRAVDAVWHAEGPASPAAVVTGASPS
ncbi:MAG: hemerythrin domain-containing protein [Acidimicrobiia bacterium]